MSAGPTLADVAGEALLVVRRAVAERAPLPFEWVVKHAPDGDVQRAFARLWDACAWPWLLRVILAALEHPTAEGYRRGEAGPLTCSSLGCVPTCAPCMARVRAAVPVAPDLTSALAARATKGG